MESEKNCLRVSGLIDCRTLHAIPEGELAELLKAVDRAVRLSCGEPMIFRTDLMFTVPIRGNGSEPFVTASAEHR